MKARSNRWLSKIRKSVRESTDHEAVHKFVHQFRQNNEPLELICARIGIDLILREPLPFEGAVYDLDGKRIIKLNSLSLPVRQRFTLGHEIGHLLLEKTFKVSTACTSDAQLEKACDMISAELLMPLSQLLELAQHVGRQSPEKLGLVANHFGVSLRAAAQRLYDTGAWKLAMGMWKLGPVAKQVWFVGKRPWKTDYPSFSAFELALDSSIPVQTKERFQRGAYSELIALKAHHIGKQYVVAVVATV